MGEPAHDSALFTAAGCLETEDVYGDALADIPNIVVFVNLAGATPLLHCISWYDLRAVLEAPGVPLSERMRLWRSDETVPSNYVYRVLDRWFDPTLEPFSRYYNTFLLYDSYEARVGTQLAVSAIHGATERLHRVRPIHRRDVVDYVRGELTAGELRACLAATVGGLPGAVDGVEDADEDAVVFEPMPEDAVRPAVLYRGAHIVLARPFEGRPFGHAVEWQLGRPQQSTTYDGTVAVGERAAREREARERVIRQPFPRVPGSLQSAPPGGAPAVVAPEEPLSAYRFEVHIPGLHHVYNVVLGEDGSYHAQAGEPLFHPAREMGVVSDDFIYEMQPTVRGGEPGGERRVALHSDPPLDDEGNGAGDPPALVAFRRFLARRVQYDVAEVLRGGELLVQFTDGLDVYWYNDDYVYVADGHPAFYPPLSVGVFDFTLPGVAGRQRVLIGPTGQVRCFVYNSARCQFDGLAIVPEVIIELLEWSPLMAGLDNRTYLYADNDVYLVDDHVTYSLQDGSAVYPMGWELLQIGRNRAIWDYDADRQLLTPAIDSAADREVERPPASLISLLQMLEARPAFSVRYAAGRDAFRVWSVDGQYYCGVAPYGVPPGEPYEVEATHEPFLLLDQYTVTTPQGRHHVSLPPRLPATRAALIAPSLPRDAAYLRLLLMQYESYVDIDLIATNFQLVADAIVYDIAQQGEQVALLTQGRPAPLPNLWNVRALQLQRRDGSMQRDIARDRGCHVTAHFTTDWPTPAEQDMALAVLRPLAALLNRQFPWLVRCGAQCRR